MVTWQGESDVANETDCSMSIGRLRLMIAKQRGKSIVKTAVRKKGLKACDRKSYWMKMENQT